MADKIYVCDICHHANHAMHYRCSACGTVPAAYSLNGKPGSFKSTEYGPHWTNTVVAKGASRTEERRGHRVYLRTVPADYYADSK